MLEMSTSGLMSGEGKRAGAFALRTAPFLDSTPCPRLKMRQGLQWRGVRGIQQSEMHASGLSTGSAKFRILSGDPEFRFELDARRRRMSVNEGLVNWKHQNSGSCLGSQASDSNSWRRSSRPRFRTAISSAPAATA
jgi:hypothetical protein